MKNSYAGKNYRVVKPLAILTVVTSHYWGGLWWVPTAISLFLFGFSSGYFTSMRYPYKVDIDRFWKSKFYRLVPRLFIINLFLSILFLCQGKTGIFSWHTIIHFLGLSGFLNWLYIQNQSPFGMGLWFFTVLLLFYMIYPFLAALKQNKYIEFCFLTVVLIALSWLQFHIKFGYQLWLTAFSFIAGVYFSNRSECINPLVLMGLGALAFILIVIFNVIFNMKDYNYYFIVILSITSGLFLLVWPLPSIIVKGISWMDAMVLEIYFIHPYLFIHYDRYSKITLFFFSVIIILVISYLLSKAGRFVETLIK